MKLRAKHITYLRPAVNQNSITALFLIASLVTLLVNPFSKPKAADFTNYYIFLDRIIETNATGGTICAKPATVAVEDEVKITWPSGYTVNGTAGNWTVSTATIPTSVLGVVPTAWPSIATATDVTSSTVTFPSGNLTVGTLYCFHFSGTNTLTTPAATSGAVNLGTIISYASAAPVDSSSFGMAIVSAGADQVAVSASVPGTFSFALNSNSIGLGSITTSSVTSGNVTMTISTNAKNGWTSWVKSANAALSSTNSGGSIASTGTYPTVSDISGGGGGYVLDADATTGSPTIAAGYDGGDTNSGGRLNTRFEHLAYKTAPVSGNVVTLNVRAKPSATTPYATDYADTLTVVASGSF